ncbi:MAG: hypothetical protein K2J73_04785 [Oscillospiraceae bacterium]|nr:hypothetical protein [Oscillospiraceae bacterium]
MSKSVRHRHNKDGSITTTTTYSHKNIFGTRVVDTYTTRSSPKTVKNPTKIKTSNAVAIIIAVVLIFMLWIFGIELSWNATLIKAISILIITLFVAFMLVNNIPPLKVLVLSTFLLYIQNARNVNGTKESEVYKMKVKVRKKVLKTINADWVNLCMYGLD